MKRALLFGMTLMLANCQLLPQSIRDSEQTIVDGAVEQTSRLDQTQTHEIPWTQKFDKSWLGPKQPIALRQAEIPPPAELYEPIEITLIEPASLRSIARLLSAHSAVQVQVAEDVQNETLSDLEWSGTTLSALDHITDRLGVSWRSTLNGVQIYRTEYGFWTLYLPNAAMQWRATVGLSGAISAEGGGSNLSAQDQVVVDMDTSEMCENVALTIEKLISPEGGTSLNCLSGELIVRDTPAALNRVDRWVLAKNEELSTQVQILVELYEIEQTEDASAGFDLSGFFLRSLGETVVQTQVGTDETGGVYGITVAYDELLDATTDYGEILLTLRKAAGTGQIAKLTSTVLRGMNGMPTPVFFGDETSYLQRRDVIKSEGDVSVRLIAGQLQDGIALNMVPKVLPDSDRMMLNLTMRTTRIKGISRFPVDAGPSDPVIQLPDLESRSMLLPVLMRSGDTLLVAGFDTDSSRSSKDTSLLARLRSANIKRSQLVMLITPTILRMTARAGALR